MDDEDDEIEIEDDEEVTMFPSCPLSPIDVVIAVLATFRDVAHAVGQGTERVIYLLACHANYKHDQVEFAEAARLEIESIPTKE